MWLHSKLRTFNILGFLLLYTISLHAAEIEFWFTGGGSQTNVLYIMTYNGQSTRQILLEKSISRDTSFVVNLEIFKNDQFVTLSGLGFDKEVYLKKDEKYLFEYNFSAKKWIAVGSNNLLNDLLIKVHDAYTHILLKRPADSVTLMNDLLAVYHSPLVDSIKSLEEYPTMKRYLANTICNAMDGLKIHKPDLNKDYDLSKFLIQMLEIEKIDLKKESNQDERALSHFFYYSLNGIMELKVPEGSGMIPFYMKCERWLEKQNLSLELKTHILGSFISFYWMLPHAINKEERSYLENFLERFPNSRHRKIIREELEKPVDETRTLSLFNPSMKNILGEAFDLHQVKEKVILVDLWASWCGPCIKEFPFLKILEEEFKGKVKFIKVSIDTDLNKWQEANRRHELEEENSYFLEKEALDEFTSNYSISAIPRYLLVRKNGRIINDNFYHPQDPKAKELLQKTVALP